MKKVVLTFDNYLNLEIAPVDNELGQLWFDQLVYSVQQNVVVERDCNWFGWPKQSRDVIIAELAGRIKTVETYLKSINYDFPMIEYGDLNSCLNTVHSYFENLHGVIEDQSPVFKNAPIEIKFAIRKTNTLTHQIEGLQSQASNEYYPWLNIGFMSNYRIPVPEHLNELFDVNLELGGVYLHYSQVGKTHYEVFYDKDDIIHDASICGCSYITGEFDIAFHQWAPSYRQYVQTNFNKWIVESGFNQVNKSIDYMGKLHPTGWGKVAMAQFPIDGATTMSQLNDVTHLTKLTVIHDRNTYTIECNYADEFSQQQQALTNFMSELENADSKD